MRSSGGGVLEPPTPAATPAQGERTGACRGRPESPSEHSPIRIAQADDETGGYGKAVGGGREAARAQRGPSSLPTPDLPEPRAPSPPLLPSPRPTRPSFLPKPAPGIPPPPPLSTKAPLPTETLVNEVVHHECARVAAECLNRPPPTQ